MNTVVIEAPAVVERPAPADRDTLVVVVTHEDIREGVQFSGQMCPIARAANRVLPGGMCADMTLRDGLLIYTFAHRLVAQLDSSGAASAWARRFDHDRGSVAPERFVFVRRT